MDDQPRSGASSGGKGARSEPPPVKKRVWVLKKGNSPAPTESAKEEPSPGAKKFAEQGRRLESFHSQNRTDAARSTKAVEVDCGSSNSTATERVDRGAKTRDGEGVTRGQGNGGTSQEHLSPASLPDPDADLPLTPDGRVDITGFKKHRLNPNTYTEERLQQLIGDVRANGGPCQQIKVMGEEDGTWTVLSGWHNLVACLKCGIIAVERGLVEAYDQMDLPGQIGFLHGYNRRGTVSAVATGRMFAQLRQDMHMSVRVVAPCVGEDPMTVQRCLDRYDICVGLSGGSDVGEAVYRGYAEKIDSLSRDAVAAIRRVKPENRETLAELLSNPSELCSRNPEAERLVPDATAMWDSGPMSGPEAECMVELTTTGDDAISPIEALEQMLRQPAKLRGRPKATKVHEGTDEASDRRQTETACDPVVATERVGAGPETEDVKVEYKHQPAQEKHPEPTPSRMVKSDELPAEVSTTSQVDEVHGEEADRHSIALQRIDEGADILRTVADYLDDPEELERFNQRMHAVNEFRTWMEGRSSAGATGNSRTVQNRAVNPAAETIN